MAQLLESARQRQWDVKGGFVSLVIHAGLAFSLVTLASGIKSVMHPKPEERPVRFAEVIPPQQAVRNLAAHAGSAMAASAEALREMVMPIVIPDIIPAVPDVAVMSGSVNADFPRSNGLSGSDSPTENGARGAALTTHGAYDARTMERPPATIGLMSVTYPEMLRLSGVEGQVVAEFVIDTLGKAEMDTFHATNVTHALFEQAARSAISKARFLPGEVHGRKVRSLVSMPFQFNLSK